MSNENLGENVNKKETNILLPSDYPKIDTPEYKNEEGKLINEKEAREQKNIDKINEAISSFEEIRKKYSHENHPDTSAEERDRLSESRKGDNLHVMMFMKILQSEKDRSDSPHDIERANRYLKMMNDFLNNEISII
ncbi:hypothetical protein IPN41_03170 [Candidatus Falkowbacteria bacterium]|nr:MAG: hypothetical protein IPN41_03170 [Candidatus Falkowbacteria bacterium]